MCERDREKWGSEIGSKMVKDIRRDKGRRRSEMTEKSLEVMEFPLLIQPDQIANSL